MKSFIFLLFFTGILSGANSQILSLLTPAKVDTVIKPPPPLPRTGLKSYSSVITQNYQTQKGLFTVHKWRDTVYFEIPDSLLLRDIMVINRLEKGPGGYGAYAGEELDEKTIQFEKGPDSSIRIRYDLVISDADSASTIYKAVLNSNLNPVVISFPIKAYGKDSASYVIDVSKFLKGAEFVNSIDHSNLAQHVDAKQMKDFNIESIHAYPINVEISISKNTVSKPLLLGSAPGPVSLVTHTSFIALPKVPLQRRFFDPRVGFFADEYYAYGDQQQKVEKKRFILRWRLEPREEDRKKWERGELVEPKSPLVFYIDPATPKQWRKYLILGINDWQKAFEKAGFKNAIQGKEWPESDSTLHMDDARYSFLNYFPSEIQNAYGPQIHDPRSGEIIQSHIGWYHNVMQLLHDWYMIQAAAVDPRARRPKFDEELMGQLIRFVSSHEVGHTLGLRHNFGSSSRTPVDSLRSRTWLEAHGHTASIMDYARFDYVAQPEDNIPEEDLFPRIGEYDCWAIEWGYKSSFAATAEEDNKRVNRWITDSLAKNPRLWFGDGEEKKGDPRCQTEDLGDNAMKASAYGIKNLQRILPNLPAWTHEEGGHYENLNELYKALKDQYTRYMTHVLKNLGGAYYTVRSEDGPGEVYSLPSPAMQKEALTFFNGQLFDTPYWLLDKNVIYKASEPAATGFVEDLQVKVLNTLLDIKQINLMLGNVRQFGTSKALPVDEYIAIIHEGVWRELRSTKPVIIDPYRRNLQKSYLGALKDIMFSNDAEETETDAYSIVRADLLRLQGEVERALPQVSEPLSRYHMEDIAARIKKALAVKMN